MIYEFRFPDIGEGVAEGEIVKWHVKPGDVVEEEQLVADVLTDKATVEITAPVSGAVQELLASEGDMIRVGSVIITFVTEGASEAAPVEPPQTSTPSAKAGDAAITQASTSGSSDGAPQPSSANSVNNATPAAAAATQTGKKRLPLAVPTVRRLARELNVDLSLIEGTGKNGRITAEDVRAYVDGSSAPLADSSGSGEILTTAAAQPVFEAGNFAENEERVPLRGIRRTIAQSMQASVNTAAHCSIYDEIDITELVKLRKQINENNPGGVKLTYMPFIMKAVVQALKKHSKFNASIDDEKQEIVYKKYYHIGFAADTPTGLVVPVVKHADKKSIVQLSAEIAELANKARSQKIKMEELKGSTFTISNIGSTGVGTYSSPVINLPEVAILGVNKIQKKPVVMNDTEIAIRDMLGINLTMDHRLIDGADGAYFLKDIITYLIQPNLMFLEMV